MKTMSLMTQPPSTIPKNVGICVGPGGMRPAIRMMSAVIPRKSPASSTPTSALASPVGAGDEEADDRPDARRGCR